MSTFSSRNTAFLSTLVALEALDRGPSRVREYSPEPAADHDVANFQRKVNRDRNWREELPEIDDRDAERFFEDEQAPGGDRR